MDERIYGLPMYLDVPIELIRRSQPTPEYWPTAEPWDEELAELGRASYRHLFLVRGKALPALEERVTSTAVSCHKAAGPHDLHLLICEAPGGEASTPHGAASDRW